jgi:hypothetical protein
VNPLYILVVAAVIGAASVWGFRHEDDKVWAGPLGLFGAWVAFVAASISVVTWVGDMREDRIAALEKRYDITIEEASFGQKPEPWRINGKWYTCYMAEATTEGEPRDLMCASPSADFETADRL